MEVLVQFEKTYAGPPSDAVWIISSPENRTWFERHVGSMDSNSAIFDDDVAPLTVIRHVFDHHPDWTEIDVRGASLTAEIEQGLQPDAVVVSRGMDEFRLRRR